MVSDSERDCCGKGEERKLSDELNALWQGHNREKTARWQMKGETVHLSQQSEHISEKILGEIVIVRTVE